MIKTPDQKKEERKAVRFLVLISQIGICMMVPVFFCVFAGQWISVKLGQPLLFPLMLLLGILAGFKSCWSVIARFTGLKLTLGLGQGEKEDPDRKGGREADADKMDELDSEGQ